MINFRKLKIHTKYQARTNRGVTIPQIVLKGKWLDELGFKKGEIVLVKQEKNKLTITIDK